MIRPAIAARPGIHTHVRHRNDCRHLTGRIDGIHPTSWRGR
jgi:hypothetical protein